MYGKKNEIYVYTKILMINLSYIDKRGTEDLLLPSSLLQQVKSIYLILYRPTVSLNKFLNYKVIMKRPTGIYLLFYIY